MYGPRNIPEAAFWLAAFVAIGLYCGGIFKVRRDEIEAV